MFAKAVIGIRLLILVAAETDFDDRVEVRVAELERKLNSQLELSYKQEARIKALSAITKDSPRMLHTVGGNEGNATEVKEEVMAYIDDRATDIAGAMTHIWLLVCGALVMFMQAGFAMVESGCCRAKNVQNIMLKNFTDVCVGTLGWWATGWAFAYGGPYGDDILPNGFIGSQQFFGGDFLTYKPDGEFEGTDAMLNWFFQWAFCSAASTIVSGGVAERVNFPGYCIFSLMMTAFVYPVVVAWTWGYGFWEPTTTWILPEVASFTCAEEWEHLSELPLLVHEQVALKTQMLSSHTAFRSLSLAPSSFGLAGMASTAVRRFHCQTLQQVNWLLLSP